MRVIDNWKHPHGRGEISYQSQKMVSDSETPPRAWGNLVVFSLLIVSLRNTPTGVGKSILINRSIKLKKKHPHGRGEIAIMIKATDR